MANYDDYVIVTSADEDKEFPVLEHLDCPMYEIADIEPGLTSVADLIKIIDAHDQLHDR